MRKMTMKTYKTIIKNCTITPDPSFTEGYTIKPGIDIRLPDKNNAVTSIIVRTDGLGHAIIFLNTDYKDNPSPYVITLEETTDEVFHGIKMYRAL
jgi:hypothetical protein